MNDQSEAALAGAVGRRLLAALALAAVVCLLAALVPAPASAAAPASTPWLHTHVPTHLGFQLYWWDDSRTASRDTSVTGYDVQYREKGAATWISQSHSGTVRAVEFSGLNAGTQYEARVRATNSDGNGAWSGIFAVSAVTVYPETANPPFPVQVEAGDGEARVTWGQPSRLGGQAQTGYVIRLYGPSDTLLRRITVSGAGTTSRLVTGLTNGREYSIDMFATGGQQGEDGLASLAVEFTPSDKMTNSQPTGVTLSTKTLAIDEGGSGTFTVALTGDPGSSLTVTLVKAPYIIDPVTGSVRYGFEKDPATVNPATLTFTSGQSGNYATPQEVTVSGAQDDDAHDELMIILLMVDITPADQDQDMAPVYEPVGGRGSGNAIAGVAVTVTDDDR